MLPFSSDCRAAGSSHPRPRAMRSLLVSHDTPPPTASPRGLAVSSSCGGSKTCSHRASRAHAHAHARNHPKHRRFPRARGFTVRSLALLTWWWRRLGQMSAFRAGARARVGTHKIACVLYCSVVYRLSSAQRSSARVYEQVKHMWRQCSVGGVSSGVGGGVRDRFTRRHDLLSRSQSHLWSLQQKWGGGGEGKVFRQFSFLSFKSRCNRRL